MHFITVKRKGGIVKYSYRFIVLLFSCFMYAAGAAAQGFPAKPVKLVVGFSAGGGSDLVARILAKTLSEKLGQTVVVENKPGAGGVIATRGVAKEKPDGYTLLLGSAAAFVINPYMRADVGYDPIQDFTPVGSVARFEYVLLGRKNLPVSSLSELINYATSHPDGLTIGSAGIGANTHLVALRFMTEAGIKLRHIPYKGTAGALNDLLGGNIDLLFDSVPTVLGQVKTDAVKAFATTGAQRETEFPQVQTIAESGLKGFEASNWFAVFAPAGLDPAIMSTLNRAINESLNDPELLDSFKKTGNIPLIGTPSDLSELVEKETTLYKTLIDNAGIRIQ